MISDGIKRTTLGVLLSMGLFSGPLLGDGAFDAIPMSKEIAYGTYAAQAGRVEVVVGAYLAGLDEAEDYIPFQMAIGVTGKGPELSVRIEDFELHDAQGKTYQVATPAEVGETDLNPMVRQFRKTQPLNTGNHFTNSRIVASDFFPLTGDASTEAHLERETYMLDVVYFPRPSAGLDGEMMFSFYTKGMQEGPVNVLFKTPSMHKKHKKQAEKIRTADD